jgi:hypothetical protein
MANRCTGSDAALRPVRASGSLLAPKKLGQPVLQPAPAETKTPSDLPETTMSNALHYRSNLRDIQFNLFEVSQIGSKVLGKEPYGAMDEDSARDALSSP